MTPGIDADGKEIFEGWYWAWQIKFGVNKDGSGPWCLVHVAGIAPFLSIRMGIYYATDDCWDHGEQLNLTRSLLDPTEWEFGSRVMSPYDIETEEALNDTGIS